MVTPELLQYIERSLADNIPEENIRKALVDAGWNPADAEEGMRSVKNKKTAVSFPTSVSTPVSPSTSTPVSVIKTSPAQPTLQPASQQVSKDTSRLVSQALNQMSPKKSRAPAIVISLVILLLLGGGGFAAYWYGFLPSEWFTWLPQQSQPQETIPNQPESQANTVDILSWEMYANEKYGFEVKYPNTWVSKKSENNISVYIKGNNSEEETGYLSIGALPEYRGKTLEETYNSKHASKTALERECTVTTFMNIPAYNCSPVDTFSPEQHILFQKGDLPFEIIDLFQNTTTAEIIGTFKFTSSTSQVDTSSWKTYRNGQYGFEFKYPMGWATTTVKLPLIVSVDEHPDWGGASGGVFVATTKTQTVSEAQAFAQKEAEDKLKISSSSPAGYPRYTMPELVTIANTPAIKRSYQSYEIVPSGIDYIFPEKGLMLTLTDLYDNNQKIEAGSSEIQQAILSTFKFTK